MSACHLWLGSGTIGAARVAALWGVPAIAVSGIDVLIPGALDAAVNFVVRLARSTVAKRLEGGRYLTVSIPRLPPAEIKGVRVAPRAGILLDFSFSRVPGNSSAAGGELWQMLPPQRKVAADAENDASLYAGGWVVVVPMRANEDDIEVLAAFRAGQWTLPPWIREAPGAAEGGAAPQEK